LSSTDRFGNASSAFYFNNGYATAPPGVYFDPSTGGSTVMVWFKAVSINTWQRVIDFGVSNSENIQFGNFAQNTTIYLHLNPGGLRTVSVSTVSLNAWVHLTVTFTTTSTNIYFNGIFDATKSGMIL